MEETKAVILALERTENSYLAPILSTRRQSLLMELRHEDTKM